MILRVFSCLIALLLLAVPVYAQQVETRLSDALFYEQLSQQSVSVLTSNSAPSNGKTSKIKGFRRKYDPDHPRQ